MGIGIDERAEDPHPNPLPEYRARGKKRAREKEGVNASSCGSQTLFFYAGDDFVDSDAEVVVEDEDLAAGDEAFVDEDIDGIAGEFVEFDDASFGEFQDVFDEHAVAAEFDFNVEFDVAEEVDAGDLRVLHDLLEGGEIQRFGVGGWGLGDGGGVFEVGLLEQRFEIHRVNFGGGVRNRAGGGGWGVGAIRFGCGSGGGFGGRFGRRLGGGGTDGFECGDFGEFFGSRGFGGCGGGWSRRIGCGCGGDGRGGRGFRGGGGGGGGFGGGG